MSSNQRDRDKRRRYAAVLPQVRDATEAKRQATERLREADEKWRRSIADAVHAEVPLRRIAEDAGVTHTHVRKIARSVEARES